MKKKEKDIFQSIVEKDLERHLTDVEFGNYLDDNINSYDKIRFSRHLQFCLICRYRFEEFKEIYNLLSLDKPLESSAVEESEGFITVFIEMLRQAILQTAGEWFILWSVGIQAADDLRSKEFEIQLPEEFETRLFCHVDPENITTFRFVTMKDMPPLKITFKGKDENKNLEKEINFIKIEDEFIAEVELSPEEKELLSEPLDIYIDRINNG